MESRIKAARFASLTMLCLMLCLLFTCCKPLHFVKSVGPPGTQCVRIGDYSATLVKQDCSWHTYFWVVDSISNRCDQKREVEVAFLFRDMDSLVLDYGYKNVTIPARSSEEVHGTVTIWFKRAAQIVYYDVEITVW